MMTMRGVAILLLGLLAVPAFAQPITPSLFRCLFAPGSATVIPLCEDSARALLDFRGAGIAAGTPLAHIDVLGSASTAEARRDPGLAQRRAAVVAALLVRIGFSPDRMTVGTSALDEPVVLIDPFAQPRCVFASGSAMLMPACAGVLRGVLALVADYPAARRATLELDVNGFTDDREARHGPPGLAARRAEAVVQALRAAGLATQTLNARGHGPEGALRPTDRADASARVVGIVVLPPPTGAPR